LDNLREAGVLISKLNQISGRIFDKKLKSCGISDLNSAQGRIMFVLWKNDDIPIIELARHTSLGKTTLTSMLNRMEQIGHIKRTIDKSDKRKTIVSLTEKSKQLKGKYEKVSREMIELFYQGVTEQQIDGFESMLRQILTNLIEYEESLK